MNLSFCFIYTEKFLSYGNISVDIGVTSAPVITADYIESYHKVHSIRNLTHAHTHTHTHYMHTHTHTLAHFSCFTILVRTSGSHKGR